MPLQSSGPISLSDIAQEFNNGSPYSLSEFYGAASGIPSSGTISMSHFYGASNLILWIKEFRYISNGTQTHNRIKGVTSDNRGRIYIIQSAQDSMDNYAVPNVLSLTRIDSDGGIGYQYVASPSGSNGFLPGSAIAFREPEPSVSNDLGSLWFSGGLLSSYLNRGRTQYQQNHVFFEFDQNSTPAFPYKGTLSERSNDTAQLPSLAVGYRHVNHHLYVAGGQADRQSNREYLYIEDRGFLMRQNTENGSLSWMRVLDNDDLMLGPGAFIHGGQEQIFVIVREFGFSTLVKYDESGNQLFAKKFGGDSETIGFHKASSFIDARDSGGTPYLYLSSEASGPYMGSNRNNVSVVKFDTNGTLLWSAYAENIHPQNNRYSYAQSHNEGSRLAYVSDSETRQDYMFMAVNAERTSGVWLTGEGATELDRIIIFRFDHNGNCDRQLAIESVAGDLHAKYVQELAIVNNGGPGEGNGTPEAIALTLNDYNSTSTLHGVVMKLPLDLWVGQTSTVIGNYRFRFLVDRPSGRTEWEKYKYNWIKTSGSAGFSTNGTDNAYNEFTNLSGVRSNSSIDANHSLRDFSSTWGTPSSSTNHRSPSTDNIVP
jgi:hypothetical protein